MLITVSCPHTVWPRVTAMLAPVTGRGAALLLDKSRPATWHSASAAALQVWNSLLTSLQHTNIYVGQFRNRLKICLFVKSAARFCDICFSVRLRSSYARYCDRLSVRLSVCPSVCPSVKRVYCDKTKAPSEKSSIMTNRKSPTSFPMSLR